MAASPSERTFKEILQEQAGLYRPIFEPFVTFVVGSTMHDSATEVYSWQTYVLIVQTSSYGWQNPHCRRFEPVFLMYQQHVRFGEVSIVVALSHISAKSQQQIQEWWNQPFSILSLHVSLEKITKLPEVREAVATRARRCCSCVALVAFGGNAFTATDWGLSDIFVLGTWDFLWRWNHNFGCNLRFHWDFSK